MLRLFRLLFAEPDDTSSRKHWQRVDVHRELAQAALEEEIQKAKDLNQIFADMADDARHRDN